MGNFVSRLLLGSIILGSVGFPTTSAFGTDIVLTNPDNGELIGYQGNYSAKNYNTGPSSTFKWAIRQNDQYAVTAFGPDSSGPSSAAFNWSVPGTFVVRLTVSYGGTSGGPGPADDVVLRTVTIDPPTAGAALNSNKPQFYTNNEPSSTSVQGTDGYYLFIPLYAGSITVGPHIGGAVQEQITALFIFGVSQGDQPVAPNPPTQSNVKFQIQNVTIDNKNTTQVCIADWKYCGSGASSTVGTINSYYQELFYTWNDALGNAHTISLGKTHWYTTGNGGQPPKWQVGEGS